MTDNNMTKPTRKRVSRLRWSWFPSLFFGDGMLLSVLVLTMVMLRRFGLNNAQTTLYVSLLCIPFALRPILEIAVTYFRGTNKVWILSAEFISALALWAIAFTLPTNYWFQGTMYFMPIIVTVGVLYDIATERFYTDNESANNLHHDTMAKLFFFTAMLFGIGVVVMMAGNMEVITRNVRYSWSFIFYLMAGIEFLLWLWHSIFLPGKNYLPLINKDIFGLDFKECRTVLYTSTHGLCNRSMLCFVIIFAIPEALMLMVSPLFLIDAPHNGGLGLAPQEFGLAYGTIGIIAFFCGRMAGNSLIHRHGLRGWLLPITVMAIAHGYTLLYLSYNINSSLSMICLTTLIANMTSGLGYSAYASVVGHYATLGSGSVMRRAIAKGTTCCTIILIGMFAGLLQINIGYRQFFILSVALYTLSVFSAIAYLYATRHKKQALSAD